MGGKVKLSKESIMEQNMKKAFEIAAEIASKYGLTLDEYDFDYDHEDSAWVVTPYQGDGGFKCREGLWWGVNIDSFNIRLMEGDFDMFDEVAKALADIYPEE